MKYDWNNQTGEKPAKKFAVFPVMLATAAFVAVVVYLVISSPGTT